MDSSEIRFKYKNRGKKYVMPRGIGRGKPCSEDPDWEEVSPGRYRKKGQKHEHRENRAANENEFMGRQVLKHELLLRDIDEGKF